MAKTYEIPNSKGGYTTVSASSKSKAVSKVPDAKLKSAGTNMVSTGAPAPVAPVGPDAVAEQNAPPVAPTAPIVAPTAPTQPPATAPVAPTNEFSSETGEKLAPGSSYINAQGQTIKQGSKYEQALSRVQQMGEAPSTEGAAMSTIKGAVAQEADTTFADTAMAESPDLQSYLQEALDFLSPQNQKDSILKEYDRLYENSGIEKLDQELIDAETIIDGTEDDIRNEVQTAGGFATDSQVQAMALARNKGLLKRYNQLFATREAAQKRLDTMVQLSAQDRQFAMQKMEMSINTAFKVAEFKQQATNNIREQSRWLTQTMGADGLYNAYKSDPRQLGFLEKSLGLAPGGLSVAAQTAAAERAQKAQMDALDIRYKNAQINNASRPDTEVVDVGGTKVLINSQTGERIADIGGGAPSALNITPINPQTGRADPRSQIAQVIQTSGAKTDDKLKLTGAVVSAAQAFAENNLTGNIEGLGLGNAVPGYFLSQKGTTNRTDISSLEGTVESWMTGASVAEDQAKRIKKDMVPSRKDSDGVVRKKINALVNYMMNYSAGNLATQGVQWAPESIDLFANPVVAGPDGQEYEIAD